MATYLTRLPRLANIKNNKLYIKELLNNLIKETLNLNILLKKLNILNYSYN